MANENTWTKFNGTFFLNNPIEKELVFSTGKELLPYEKVEQDQEFIPNIYVYRNLSIGSGKGEAKRIKGPVFLMYQTAAYVHFLLDGVGVYYGIKKHIPGLQPYFLNPHNYRDNSISFDKDWLYLDGHQNPNSKILDLRKNKYIFDEVYDFDFSGRKKTVSTMYVFPFMAIRENLLNKISINENSAKKIYISRIDSGNRSVKDIAGFEMYLADKGFSLIRLSHMNLEAQMEIFFNAKDIVCFSGSGLTNTVFCSSEANIIEINRSPDTYTYNTWAKNCKSIGINYIGISFLGDKESALSDVDQIKDSVKYIQELI